MQAMKGATMALGSMNKTMNLPSLQRIAMEFERENDIMEQRQEMMDDAIDDAMDVGLEEEGDEVVERVLEEIGVDLSQAVRQPCPALHNHLADMVYRWAKRQQVSKPMLPQKARLPKPLAGVVVVVVAAVPLTTMIYRHAWIACDDKPELRMWYLPTKRMMGVGEAWSLHPPPGCCRVSSAQCRAQRTAADLEIWWRCRVTMCGPQLSFSGQTGHYVILLNGPPWSAGQRLVGEQRWTLAVVPVRLVPPRPGMAVDIAQSSSPWYTAQEQPDPCPPHPQYPGPPTL